VHHCHIEIVEFLQVSIGLARSRAVHPLSAAQSNKQMVSSFWFPFLLIISLIISLIVPLSSSLSLQNGRRVSILPVRGFVKSRGPGPLFAAPHDSNTDVAPITFASYVVYKGKGAVTVKAIAPTFATLSNKARNVGREGGLLLEFAQASGQREYNWAKRGTFLLDVNECGTLMFNINQAQMGSGNGDSVEFIHDPNIGTAEAGKTNKKMRWTGMADGSGVFIGLQVNEKSVNGQAPQSTTYSVPLSWGEVEVLKTLITHCIPRFLGFDKIWDNPGLSLPPGVSSPSPPPPPEWKSFN